MADVPQTTTLIVTAQEYAGDIVRQVNRRCTTLRLIPITIGKGDNVAWGAEGDGQLAEEYQEGADASNFGSDEQAPAVLNWSQMRSNFRVTGLAMAVAGTQSTPVGNIALWSRNLINSSAKLADLVNKRIHSGSGTGTPKQISGFGVAIGDDTNTYATIDRSTEAYWRPTVVDPGTSTQISLAQIRSDIAAIFKASGEQPDLAAVSPAVFNQVAGLFDSSRRYTQMADTVNTRRGAIKLDAGYEALIVDGCAFYKDKDAVENQIRYLNSNYIELQVLPQPALRAMMPGLSPGMMLSANDGFGAIPLLFQYEMLAVTGDSKKAEVRLYGELKIEKPNAFGVRKNVAA